MTPCQPTDPTTNRTAPFPWTRADVASAFDHFATAEAFSQRQYARQYGIPRSTLGDWLRPQAPDGLDPQLFAFLRGSAGERFLRVLFLALFLVFHLRGACGLRLLGEFLCLTGLDHFVASSYGALHSFATCLEELLAAFADEERPLLAQDMLQRLIALIADENFHGTDPCLVAIEPVSDFIFAEEYQKQRDAVTWTNTITRATAGLAVQVVLLTSDEARGLICCANKHLHVRHMPELFHGQRDLARPLFGPLQRHIAAARKELEEAKQLTQYWRDEKERAASEPASPGRPKDHDGRISLAASMEHGCTVRLQRCEQHKEQAKEAVRGLADDYHPFDPQTGQPNTAEQVEQRLQQRLATLERLTEQAELPKQAKEAVTAGKKWLVALVANMAWFWALARQEVEGLDLPEEAEKEVYDKLLPGLYWQQAARRARTAEQRQQKRELAEQLLQEAWRGGGPLVRLAEEERQQVQRVAQEVVGLFCRSSSAVEGRNGRLALFQHGHTRLSERKLKALTAVHNYVVRRPDGSTAAERFFGKKQRDPFAWLLEKMPDLPRPAAKRPAKPTQPAP